MVVTLDCSLPGKSTSIEDLITINHLEKMNIIILVTGTMVGFAYITEFFIAWYSGVEYEQFAFFNRAYERTVCLGLLDDDVHVTCIFPQFFWI